MAKDFDYLAAKKELEEIITWFENDGHDINESFDKYQKAQTLISKLEKFLNDSEAKIEVITKK